MGCDQMDFGGDDVLSIVDAADEHAAIYNIMRDKTGASDMACAFLVFTAVLSFRLWTIGVAIGRGTLEK